MQQKLIQDLLDTSTYRMRKEVPLDDRRYATVVNSTTISLDGTSITNFLKFKSVGTLYAGDVVEVEHSTSDKRVTVTGKLFGTTTDVGSMTFARKTATETVTSNTVVQNDDELFASVAINYVYTVDMMAVVTGDDLGDVKFQFTYPAGATLAGGQVSLLASLAGGVVTSGSAELRAIPVQATPSTALAAGIADTNGVLVMYHGVLIMNSTAGTLQLQWAQNASSVNGTVLNIGSYLKLTRMA